MDEEKKSSEPLDVTVKFLLEPQRHDQPRKNIADRRRAHFPYIDWEEEAVRTARGFALRKARKSIKKRVSTSTSIHILGRVVQATGHITF
jgi:hypothetical protein